MFRRAWALFNGSLRRRLLLRLAALLCLLLALDALACYYTSCHFANLVYDRWLIDSNRSLATAVHTCTRQTSSSICRRRRSRYFSFDAVDTTYYRIDSSHRGFIAGERALTTDFRRSVGQVALAIRPSRGANVRVVSGRLPTTASRRYAIVTVAETLIKRSTLTREILLVMVAPQAGTAACGLLLAWINVNRGLKPLTDLAEAIDRRGHDNLIAGCEPRACQPRPASWHRV